MAITQRKKYPGDAGAARTAGPAARSAARRRRARTALLAVATAVLLAGAAAAGLYGYLAIGHG